MAIGHGRSVAHAEGAAQVFHALLAVEPRLGRCIAVAAEADLDRQPRAPAEQVGEHLGLVEFALAQPRLVQRHRHEEIDRWRLQARIVERLGHPFGQLMPQVEMVIIFEAMDELLHHALAAILRDGAEEMEAAPGAIRADEGALDRAGKRLRALLAKGCRDARSLRRAAGAEVRAGPRVGQAIGAMRRVEQARQRLPRAAHSAKNGGGDSAKALHIPSGARR